MTLIAFVYHQPKPTVYNVYYYIYFNRGFNIFIKVFCVIFLIHILKCHQTHACMPRLMVLIVQLAFTSQLKTRAAVDGWFKAVHRIQFVIYPAVQGLTCNAGLNLQCRSRPTVQGSSGSAGLDRQCKARPAVQSSKSSAGFDRQCRAQPAVQGSHSLRSPSLAISFARVADHWDVATHGPQ